MGSSINKNFPSNGSNGFTINSSNNNLNQISNMSFNSNNNNNNLTQSPMTNTSTASTQTSTTETHQSVSTQSSQTSQSSSTQQQQNQKSNRNKNKRPRVSSACTICRKRKVKCDKGKPACLVCIKHNVPHLCEYIEPNWANKQPRTTSMSPQPLQQTQSQTQIQPQPPLPNQFQSFPINSSLSLNRGLLADDGYPSIGLRRGVISTASVTTGTTGSSSPAGNGATGGRVNLDSNGHSNEIISEGLIRAVSVASNSGDLVRSRTGLNLNGGERNTNRIEREGIVGDGDTNGPNSGPSGNLVNSDEFLRQQLTIESLQQQVKRLQSELIQFKSEKHYSICSS
ncbi:unnamed protein product [Ambrosiozyma monospora]|uniref:Unnamed protein product n=1 Tax=Ambrosiozyma monospora TaxID=43982 RepID=A0A9W6SZ36_AMBMO|nr:unnamed protein product [Ambrosiozyma monospora]